MHLVLATAATSRILLVYDSELCTLALGLTWGSTKVAGMKSRSSAVRPVGRPSRRTCKPNTSWHAFARSLAEASVGPSHVIRCLVGFSITHGDGTAACMRSVYSSPYPSFTDHLNPHVQAALVLTCFWNLLMFLTMRSCSPREFIKMHVLGRRGRVEGCRGERGTAAMVDNKDPPDAPC